MKQGTQSWRSEGRDVGRGFRKRGHMFTCGWFMSMNGKDHHSIVKNYPSIKVSNLIKKEDLKDPVTTLMWSLT